MAVRYFASRDINDPTVWRDEDRAMAHDTIVRGETSLKRAKAALRQYILDEAAYLVREYGDDAFYNVHRGKLNDPDNWAAKRIKALKAAARQVNGAKFTGEKNWEAIDFDAGKLRFRLIRTAS